MNIDEIIKSGVNITLAISARDLREFAAAVAEQTRKDTEKVLTDVGTEVYYTAEQVCSLLNVDRSTLWRWDKRDYLKSVEVGGLRRWRRSDMDRLIGRK